MNIYINESIQRMIFEYCEHKPEFIDEFNIKTKDILESMGEICDIDFQKRRQYDTGETITFIISNQTGNWFIRTKSDLYFGNQDSNRYILFQRQVKYREFVIRNIIMNSCYMFY